MTKHPYAHTIDTANEAIKLKNMSGFLLAKEIRKQDNVVILIDKDYGEYAVDLKALAPLSSIPLHKARRHNQNVEAKKNKFVGKKINGLQILDVFYGPDRGYKNRSFYLEYIGDCGHKGINTYASLVKHKKTFSCRSCSSTIHGERGKIEDKLKKRTATYNFWVSKHKTLPEKYKDFEVFRAEVGDKPSGKATVQLLEGRLTWVSHQITEDKELNLIASAIRQAFRYSALYKEALDLAKVETDSGTKYRCAACKNLFSRNNVQVDHILPIKDLNGEPLKKETLIEKIWTSKIQVLDKKCHLSKTIEENKIRKTHKKKRKEENGKSS